MPGPFTHIMICEAAKNLDEFLGEELWQLLNKYYQFLFLGAESPDLAYLSIGVGGNYWADGMHYEKTNGQVISGFEALQTLWRDRTPADEAKCAWLLGYVSHMVADATVHPIINGIVGPYQESKENQENHRICEMTMDSLIFQELMQGEIRYAEFSGALKFCRESEHFEELMEFWRTQLSGNYAAMDHDPHPSLWFKTYTDAIDAAEGGKVTAIFRHLGLGGNYYYRTTEEIKTDWPDEYRKYYLEVKSPGGVGPFRSVGFDTAVTNVANIWKPLYEGLSDPSPDISKLVNNWDLDTGEDMETGIVTFWGIRL